MLTESDTRAKLIDPAIHKRGWTEDLIRREETAGAIEIGESGPRRRPRGRVDYVLRIKATLDSQPVDRRKNPGDLHRRAKARTGRPADIERPAASRRPGARSRKPGGC